MPIFRSANPRTMAVATALEGSRTVPGLKFSLPCLYAWFRPSCEDLTVD